LVMVDLGGVSGGAAAAIGADAIGAVAATIGVDVGGAGATADHTGFLFGFLFFVAVFFGTVFFAAIFLVAAFAMARPPRGYPR
jgi:hypothetical protein